ncbi:hypothetical protein [Bradyrhizobium oligotrophicum]|uniref:hypothetical protein n=1 Tax=Bradyrhizobium oligotrophicum TaxID=44255 RepID=UPI003EB816A4
MDDTSSAKVTVAARADAVASDVLQLLEFDVSYPGWEHETAKQKAFYVRGFSWFRDKVIKDLLNITDCDTYVDEMKGRLKTRSKWIEKPFEWNDDFGARQFINAASPVKRLTPKFHKAVECLLLCEVIADSLHLKDGSRPTGAEVYSNMSIEAAVSFIHGLDLGMLDNLTDNEWAALRRSTGQQSNHVFLEMAQGKTVTHKLAIRTRHFLANRKSSGRLGDASFRFSTTRKYKPSDFELIEVAPADLGEV